MLCFAHQAALGAVCMLVVGSWRATGTAISAHRVDAEGRLMLFQAAFEFAGSWSCAFLPCRGYMIHGQAGQVLRSSISRHCSERG